MGFVCRAGPLELKLQLVVNHPMWVLRTKLRSLARMSKWCRGEEQREGSGAQQVLPLPLPSTLEAVGEQESVG